LSQAINSQQLIDRIVGIVTLKDPVYEEVEHDQSATVQAALIVVVSGLLSGIGRIGDEWYSIIVVPVVAAIAWVVASYFIYLVGTRFIPSATTEADLGQVLRLTGFASITGAVGIISFIPVLGPIVGFVGAIWGIVIFVKAIMHALEMEVGRAIATAIGAWIMEIIVFVVLGLIFGIGLFGF
jgi:hypothetical protein